MANDWFQFKQFKINQSGSAMKVGTDGVLIGSWGELEMEGSKVLDVGTGTGLISLMIAQRFNRAKIKAIDMDQNAIAQARENFLNSPWNDRIYPELISIQDFAKKNKENFHLIISNPPYFRDSFKPPASARRTARHQDSLPAEELFTVAAKMLDPLVGLFSLIIPSDQKTSILKLADNKEFFPKRILNVIPKPGKEAKRCLLEFSLKMQNVSEDEIIIELLGRHEYSAEYMKLTKDFYLGF